MAFSDIVRQAVRRPAQSFSKTTYSESSGKQSFGSIVKKVVMEVEENNAKQGGCPVGTGWQDCKHLAKVGEKMTCRRFCSLCGMEKCSPKYIEKKDS